VWIFVGPVHRVLFVDCAITFNSGFVRPNRSAKFSAVTCAKTAPRITFDSLDHVHMLHGMFVVSTVGLSLLMPQNVMNTA
jgi:hypothetical protein